MFGTEALLEAALYSGLTCCSMLSRALARFGLEGLATVRACLCNLVQFELEPSLEASSERFLLPTAEFLVTTRIGPPVVSARLLCRM